MYELIFAIKLIYSIISEVEHLKVLEFDLYQSTIPDLSYSIEALVCQLFIFKLRNIQIKLEEIDSSEEHSIKLNKLKKASYYQYACMISTIIQMLEMILNNINIETNQHIFDSIPLTMFLVFSASI